MKNKIIVSILFCGLLYGCSRTLYTPVSADVALQQQLLTGRKLYVDHCSSCHNLHLPKEYDSAGWKKELNEMQPKAKITDEEKHLIFQYLTSQN